MNAGKQKKLQTVVRLFVSLALLAYVFYKAGLTQLKSTLLQADLFYLFLSVALTPLLIWASSWKWQIILRAMGIRLSAGKCFGLYAVGYFFNTILPTNVGGDVVRAYAVGKSTGKNAEAFSSVFVERFTGLAVLLAFAVLAFLLAIRRLSSTWLIAALILSVLGFFLIFFLALNPNMLSTLRRLLPFKPLNSLLLKLQKFQNATLSLRGHPRVLAFAMVNSVFFYLLAVINVYVTSWAFSRDLSFSDSLIVTPIIMVITMLPISIGGIGLAEWAYVFTFERFGLLGAVGLSTALLMRAKALLAGLFGGLYYSALGIDIKQELTPANGEKEVRPDDVEGQVNYFSSFEDVMRRRKSPLRKYQEIQIGTSRLWPLVKYELITLFFGHLPGLLGLFFRQIFYPRLFRRVGRGTVFGRSLTLQHSYKISLGEKCVLDEYCRLSAQGGDDAEIVLGNEVLLGRGTVLGTRGGRIEIGDFSNIGANCRFGTTSQIKLGKYVLLAANCYIGGAQHRFDRLDIPIMRQGYESRGGVIIEDNCWLGAGVIVLDGVRIGSGSVIGAGSVVTKDIPPNSIAVGVPARVQGTRG
ncbi:MAG: flippase-like domain-containing protein [candidate division KSB1 bacterium]|nr:flippase-like domain-containing protein [candidate division KSB1 bacterium]